MHQKIAWFTLCLMICFSAAAAGQNNSRAAVEDGITLFLAGDAIITQRWSHLIEPGFLRLVKEIRRADAAIVNLETVIHEKGYAQAKSGGTYLTSTPEIAFELAWAGVDMVTHANNHTFDYGSIGVLETLENTAKAGLILAGSGKDLQNALAPRYFKHPKGVVALISAASTFNDFNKASHSRPDLHGRPGLNPIALNERFLSVFITIKPSTASLMGKFSRALGFQGKRFGKERFKLMGMEFKVGDGYGLSIGKGGHFNLKHVEANLASIREARARADIVVFSIHAHKQKRFLQKLAYETIDAGADVFLAHGPHEIRGIEIYKGKPIIYGLGDFVFQPGLVERYPAELYEAYGMRPDATMGELRQAHPKLDRLGFHEKREAWEGVGAVIRFIQGRVAEFKLLPMDLGFRKSYPILGRPHYADPALGKYIIEVANKQSKPYQTEIEYVPNENLGLVRVD